MRESGQQLSLVTPPSQLHPGQLAYWFLPSKLAPRADVPALRNDPECSPPEHFGFDDYWVRLELTSGSVGDGSRGIAQVEVGKKGFGRTLTEEVVH